MLLETYCLQSETQKSKKSSERLSWERTSTNCTTQMSTLNAKATACSGATKEAAAQRCNTSRDHHQKRTAECVL